jgi:hydrogenase maturation protein HypF
LRQHVGSRFSASIASCLPSLEAFLTRICTLTQFIFFLPSRCGGRRFNACAIIKSSMKCLNISITGIVQGVGFRPFIHSLAKELSIRGYVTNTSEGVFMTAEGDNLETFLERIRTDAPPLSRIMSIDISPAQPAGFSDFSIRGSRETGSFTLLSPDVSVCDDCLRELFDRNDRRYLYPFINCTNCGPRYSITQSVPYDRANTTMKVFLMCPECGAEYCDPSNRRFHAQPDACAACGPLVSLRPAKGAGLNEKQDPIAGAIRLLKEGKIVAVKGLGGFHIACDASNPDAVKRLRQRKRRSNKPFALMAPDIEGITKFCNVSEEEERLLLSMRRPIVLLEKRGENALPDDVSPNNRYIGFMLPYTPLHHLLFRYPFLTGSEVTCHFDALVMTSGNISEEPIVIDNDEAVAKLSDIADAFVVHDRDIFMRVDDSVLKVRDRGPFIDAWAAERSGYVSVIRRSRGFVPDPIPLSEDGPDVLGCGADLKNTFTVTRGRYAIPGQHIGDMENCETLNFFEETLRNITSVYRAKPVAIGHDLHPDYLSTRWALRQEGVEKIGIQHHYAHIASVMAEKGIREKVIGVAFDGTGYGEDGTLWGGEFLISDTRGFGRAGHIGYMPLPGGEMAIREPWRIAVSCVKRAAGREVMEYLKPAGFVERYGREKIESILKVCEDRSLSPLSSGAGRLFDAVAALIGACDRNTFEGEAAIALESLVRDDVVDDYPVDISFREPMEIDFSMVILSILKDIEAGMDRRVISSKFHNTVAAATAAVVFKLSSATGIKKVILSGGVFQNSYLAAGISEGLRMEGLHVYTNELVPCNDGGISLGQAYIVRERIKKGSRT